MRPKNPRLLIDFAKSALGERLVNWNISCFVLGPQISAAPIGGRSAGGCLALRNLIVLNTNIRSTGFKKAVAALPFFVLLRRKITDAARYLLQSGDQND